MSSTTTTTIAAETPAPANLHQITSPSHLQTLLSADLSRPSLLSFWAAWAAPCAAANARVAALAAEYAGAGLLVLEVEADREETADVAESFEVVSVPTFVLLRGHTLLARIEGADTELLAAELAKHTRAPPTALSKTERGPAAAPASLASAADADDEDDDEKAETPAALEARLRGLMGQSRVVLFMKGAPDAPRCGFSRQTVALLRAHGVEFSHFDILTDERVRSGLKVVNNWPTFPQLIVEGEFVGGLDILKEMEASGEFDEVVNNVH